MKLAIDNFNGLYPRIESVNLPLSSAQKAIDCEVSSGALRLFSSVADTTNPVTHNPTKYPIPAIPTLTVTDLFNPTEVFTSFSFVHNGNVYPLSYVSHKSNDYGIDIEITGASALSSLRSAPTELYLRVVFNGETIESKVNFLYYTRSAYSSGSGFSVSSYGSYQVIGSKKYWGNVDFNEELYDDEGYPIMTFEDLFFEEPAPSLTCVFGCSFMMPNTFKILLKGNYLVNYSQYTKYRLTFEDNDKRQSPPCDSTEAIIRKPSQAVNLTFNGFGTTGDFTPSYINIYRAVRRSEDEDFKHLARIAYGTSTYLDKIASNEVLSYPLPVYHGTTPSTALWGNRPDNLTKVILNPTGYYIGYIGKVLWFSGLREQNHMFAEAYQIELDYDIKDIIVLGSGTVAITEYGTYMIWGQAPYEHWTQMISDLGVVNTEGLVKINDYLYYVSQVGIIRIAGSQSSIITSAYWSPEQFKEMTPSTMRLDTANDMLYLYTDTANYVLDFQSNRTDIVEITTANTTFSASSFTYKTKKFMFDQPVSFKIARVLASTYNNITLNVYINNTLSESRAIVNDKPIRLSRSEDSRYWEMEVVSSDTVYELALAQAESEFKENQ